MRVLVTGSRTWDRPEAIWAVLDTFAIRPPDPRDRGPLCRCGDAWLWHVETDQPVRGRCEYPVCGCTRFRPREVDGGVA